MNSNKLFALLSASLFLIQCNNHGDKLSTENNPVSEISHSFFIAGPQFTGIIGEKGEEIWNSNKAAARDGYVLENGNILICWADEVREYNTPIGFLSLVILLECVVRWRSFEKFKPVLSFMWLLAAISASVSALLGYLLSVAGGYDEQMLSYHKWGGISLAVLSWLCFFLSRARIPFTSMPAKPLQTFFIIIAAFCLIFTGHIGGSLTHGSDYLMEHAPATLLRLAGRPVDVQKVKSKIVSIDSLDIFNDAVMPVIRSECSACHNKDKKKGKLVLASYEDMLKGGETGPGIIPGNLARSEIFRRITLPHDHKEFMPTDGKKPLTEAQIAIIEWWIESGAPANGMIADFAPHQKMREVFEDFSKLEKMIF